MASSVAQSMMGRIRENSSAQKWYDKLVGVILANWHYGFTAFGGPPVHFQIFHKDFVDKRRWIDEQVYQELFAICQALPGPGSTKMLYNINAMHAGFTAGLFAFLIWSLPGALGMYGLSLGIARINDTLPAPVYALLSGLNAATVGIIALAAVQLSQKAITDKITRILVFLGGTAGMLYTALWYFPVLMVGGGLATLIHDYRWVHNLIARFRRGSRPTETGPDVERRSADEIELQPQTPAQSQREDADHKNSVDNVRAIPRTTVAVGTSTGSSAVQQNKPGPTTTQEAANQLNPDGPVRSTGRAAEMGWKAGSAVTAVFLVTFIAIMIVRGVVKNPPRGLALFSNMYLAGTIIFGGGPVVIPLLREYVVNEGWVSPRDFLLGLAIIQAFPGPNFNFAVYLGSLAARGTSLPTAAGALIGYVGIFGPGLFIATGSMGVWKVARRKRYVTSILRGVHASAVGLVYTAVYRLWQIGYLDVEAQFGAPLGSDPWWVTITATSFVGGMWFGVSAPAAILLGGVMGMIWYGVVRA